jgi:hypothetical protein
LNYFTLPGNERYYDFVKGIVHFFVLNSCSSEPDGVSITSTQALWLRSRLLESLYKWKIVYFHHPPYSSGYHGSSEYTRWPFKDWGVNAIFSGHEHSYERLEVQEIPYFVNGSGGKPIRSFYDILPESKTRYSETQGAQLVKVYEDSIVFRFYNVNDSLIDKYVLYDSEISILPSRDANTIKSFNIYPNPSDNEINILLKINKEDQVSICLCQMDGRIIHLIEKKHYMPGLHNIKWDTSRLYQGLYNVVLIGSDATLHAKYLLKK